MIKKYKEGIKRSFTYLREDKKHLEANFELIFSQKEVRIIKLHTLASKTKAADLALKELGYLLSASQRQEIENETSLVIGGKWAIELQDSILYIAPYVTTDMSKTFKEICRTNAIPTKIRPYLFQEGIDPRSLANLY